MQSTGWRYFETYDIIVMRLSVVTKVQSSVSKESEGVSGSSSEKSIAALLLESLDKSQLESIVTQLLLNNVQGSAEMKEEPAPQPTISALSPPTSNVYIRIFYKNKNELYSHLFSSTEPIEHVLKYFFVIYS